MLAVRIWLRTGQQKIINSKHCFGQFMSGVVSVRGAVARFRAINRCAILHIGPMVAFLSHFSAF